MNRPKPVHKHAVVHQDTLNAWILFDKKEVHS